MDGECQLNRVVDPDGDGDFFRFQAVRRRYAPGSWKEITLGFDAVV